MIVYTEVRYDTYVGFISSIHTEKMPHSNIKFTFDDDGKLIDAEFIKEKLNKEWVGLSDEELSHLKYLHVDYELFDEGEYGTECNVYVDEFARAIEQALKEKNNG